MTSLFCRKRAVILSDFGSILGQGHTHEYLRFLQRGESGNLDIIQ